MAGPVGICRRAPLALILVAAVLSCRGPSATSVVGDTTIAREAGMIQYQDVFYEVEWGKPVVKEGVARLSERARYESAPFFTHHMVLTTGDFSDPKRVKIRHTGGGNFIWTAQEKPKGTLVALHMVPFDEQALELLELIDDGDRIELGGRVETDGKVSGSDGSWLRLNHKNHEYFLVERVTLLVD